MSGPVCYNFYPLLYTFNHLTYLVIDYDRLAVLYKERIVEFYIPYS